MVSKLNSDRIIGTKYINLKDIVEEKSPSNPNPNTLNVNLKFNKSNDISSTMVDDEYYVCAYVIEDSNITDDDIINTIPLLIVMKEILEHPLLKTQ